MKTGAKKITIIFMAAAILFTLTGCRQKEVYNETVDPVDSQEITETAEVPEDQPANADESQEQEDLYL